MYISICINILKTNRANFTFYKNFLNALTKIKNASLFFFHHANAIIIIRCWTRAFTNHTEKINLNFYIDFVRSRRPTRSWIINVFRFYHLYTLYYITCQNIIQCEKCVIMSFEFSNRRYFNFVFGLLCLLYLRIILKRK